MTDPLTAALQAIVDQSQRKQGRLRELCQKAMQGARKSDEMESVDDYFAPFKVACDSQVSKVAAVALEGIYLLLEERILLGTKQVSKEDYSGATEGSILADVIVSCLVETSQSSDDLVQLQTIKCCLSLLTHVPVLKGKSILALFRLCFFLKFASRNIINQTTAHIALTRMTHILFTRLQSFSDRPLKSDPQLAKVPLCSVCGNDGKYVSSFSKVPVCSLSCHKKLSRKFEWSQVHGNCALLMTSLSGLIKEDATSADMSSQSRTLALELLLYIVNNFSSSIAAYSSLQRVLQDCLVPVLLSQVASANDSTFQLCLSLYTSLMCHLRGVLKKEIGLMLEKIYLRLAQSPNGSYLHRSYVFQLLCKMAADDDLLVDLFINFDCDASSPNLFESIVHTLDKVSKAPLASNGWISIAQEAELKVLAVKSITNMIASLQAWLPPTEDVEQGDQSIEDEDGSYTTETASQFALEEPSSSLYDSIERMKREKRQLSVAIAKFSFKPSQALRYIRKVGLVDDTPESFAHFLLNTKGISKDRIGEILSKSDDFNKQVLHHFITAIPLQNMSIDEAIRTLMAYFRLPGEGQQIDQILEKFGEHFFNENPDAFPNANIVYVLSFSIIMLNTDLHSKHIKKHMTKEEWIRNNHLIDPERYLSDDFLSDIFARIKNNEIKMNDLEAKMVPMDKKAKWSQFHKEIESINKDVSSRMNALRESTCAAYLVTTNANIDVLRAMFDLVWASALATFSILIQESKEPMMVSTCLEGYRNAIRLASTLSSDIQRDAFVNSLTSFTLLGTVKEMTFKNVEAIKMLLNIAYHEGNFLGESWGEVLRCISEYERLQLIGSGTQSDAAVFTPGASQIGRFDAMEHRQDSKNSLHILSSVEPTLIDRVFTRSSILNAEAIVFFVDYLCRTSQMELNKENSPRIFCLQKVVEITYYNMGRMRIVWTRIWHILAQHFCYAGLHSNLNISMYAVDSLRQLASKFLEKDELPNYAFQQQFLGPFLEILKSDSIEIREFLLQCLTNATLPRVSNLKSGWSTLFDILKATVDEEHHGVAQLGFDFAKQLVSAASPAESSHVKTLLGIIGTFTSSKFPIVCCKAIGELRSFLTSCEAVHEWNETWLMSLHSMGAAIDSADDAIREEALSGLFSLIRSHGPQLQKADWTLFYLEIVLPKLAADHHLRWWQTTGASLIEEVSTLVLQFSADSREFVLDVMNNLRDCIPHPCSKASLVAAQSLIRLGCELWSSWNPTEWSSFWNVVFDSIQRCLPWELLSTELCDLLDLPFEFDASPLQPMFLGFQTEEPPLDVPIDPTMVQSKIATVLSLSEGISELLSLHHAEERDQSYDCFARIVEFCRLVHQRDQVLEALPKSTLPWRYEELLHLEQKATLAFWYSIETHDLYTDRMRTFVSAQLCEYMELEEERPLRQRYREVCIRSILELMMDNESLYFIHYKEIVVLVEANSTTLRSLLLNLLLKHAPSCDGSSKETE